MRYLVDTHVLMWLVYERKKIKPRIAQLLSDHSADIHISIASLWEIIIKASLGKYPLSRHFLTELSAADVQILPVSPEHLEEVWRLPHHHSDPFDRMLVAQAVVERLTLITSDKAMTQYDAKIILA